MSKRDIPFTKRYPADEQIEVEIRANHDRARTQPCAFEGCRGKVLGEGSRPYNLFVQLEGTKTPGQIILCHSDYATPVAAKIQPAPKTGRVISNVKRPTTPFGGLKAIATGWFSKLGR